MTHKVDGKRHATSHLQIGRKTVDPDAKRPLHP
jgi:hypothetical protein